MIETWIDAMQDVWAGISGTGFSLVRAPYLYKRAEFPIAIDPKTLAVEPLALTIPGEVEFKVSAGGPNEGFYQGVTEFHIAPSNDKSLLPSLLPWYGKIITAAAGNNKLGGLVHSFALQSRSDQITGPIELTYGDEAPHWGFLAYWEVKENLNGVIVFAIGD
jgi:hypothetical protein